MLLRIFVSYFLGLLFAVYGIIFFIGARIDLPPQSKLIFLGFVLFFWLITYLIHRNEISHLKSIKLIVLLGNVFGFLFNFVYSAIKIAGNYGIQLNFGGIENFVFFKNDGLDLIEMMFAIVGGMVWFAAIISVSIYGLMLKDRFKKEGNRIKAYFSVIAAIICIFLIFLFMIFYLETYKSFIYYITGSMFLIYGVNLFKRNLNFLKF